MVALLISSCMMDKLVEAPGVAVVDGDKTTGCGGGVPLAIIRRVLNAGGYCLCYF